MEFWKSLTEGQAHLLTGIFHDVVVVVLVPLFTFFAAKFGFNKTAVDAAKKVVAGEQQGDFEASADQADQADQVGSPPTSEAASNRFSRLKIQWERVRDKLFAIAFDPGVDGRKRAKYKRIDLRGEGYQKFIASVDEDRLLGQKKPIFEDALVLWNRYRTNRVDVPDDAIKQMEDFANRA